MKNLYDRHKDLKESIGSFILAFSQMEYGLGILCTFTEFDLIRKDEHLADYLGMSLENKRRTIRNYLHKYDKGLLKTWKEIEDEIEFLNKQRRFIAHGVQHVFVGDKLYAAVKVGNKLQENDLTIDKIEKWTDRLHHVNTGKSGILGAFYGEFVTRSINRWNKHVIEDLRIVYKVDSKIVSDWKGK
jgi:hypothetical protein